MLVRHGRSRAQESRFVGGHDGCTGLSDLGRRQVGALAARLAESGELAGASVLYASVMARAVETAEILAPALGDLEVRSECAFCESHPSTEADGIGWDEFERRWPQPLADWTPQSRRDPGSESFEEMQDRVTGRLDTLLERHDGETVVVACHGGVVMHSMFRWLELDPVGNRTRAWMNPVNSSLTEWRRADHPYWRSGIELVRFNDHGHLRGDLLPHA